VQKAPYCNSQLAIGDQYKVGLMKIVQKKVGEEMRRLRRAESGLL